MYERALSAFYLEETDRIPFYQLAPPIFTKFGRKICKIDPFKEPLKATVEYLRKTDVDFIFGGAYEIDEKTEQIYEKTKTQGTVYLDYDGPLKDKWKGLKIAFTCIGSKTSSWIAERPFKTIEELEEFFDDYDPCAKLDEVGPNDVYGHAGNLYKFQESIRDSTLIPGFYYTTLWSHFFFDIGWTLLVRLIYQRPRTFEKILEKYLKYSLRIAEGFATMTDIKVFVSHDDIATGNGLMMSPEWLRKNIISRYEKIWAPIKRKGIRVVFVSDGDYTDILDDISKYADGFWFDNGGPSQRMNFRNVVQKFGDSKVIIAVSDLVDWNRALRSKQGIINGIQRCVSEAGHYLGYFLPLMIGGLGELPVSLSEFYWKTAIKYCKRK